MLKLMNQQMSGAFNAMRNEAQKAAQKRQALKFWTQRNLLAAFNAFRWDLNRLIVVRTALGSGRRCHPNLQGTHVAKCVKMLFHYAHVHSSHMIVLLCSEENHTKLCLALLV